MSKRIVAQAGDGEVAIALTSGKTLGTGLKMMKLQDQPDFNSRRRHVRQIATLEYFLEPAYHNRPSL